MSATALAGGLNISEIRINETGTDVNDYFEIDGPPSTSVNGLTYVIIGRGDVTTANGVIEMAFPLSGSINAGGHFVAAGPGYLLSAVDQIIPDFDMFASDNKTHLLVGGFTGNVGDDLDTNDDGSLDVTPWSVVHDSVAILGNASPSGANGNSFVYSATTVGPDGSFVPGHMYVCADTLDWAVGLFSPTGQTDRPQAANLNCNIAVPNVRINEVRIDQDGADNDESFELKGPPLQSLDGLTYLVIGDGSAALGSGVLEVVIPLTGLQIPADGHFLAVETSNTIAPFAQVDLSLVPNALNFENGDNVTHLLVTGYNNSFPNGTDLDTNDDGVLDITPWQNIVDFVAVISQPNPPTGTEYHYATNVNDIVGPAAPNTAPFAAFRCEPDGTWVVGSNAAGVSDTPGTLNLACSGDSCGDPGSGDCFSDNGTPGCDDSKCCNLVCAIDPACCNIVWDATCAQLANFNCVGGDPCGNPNAGSCYSVHAERGCDNGACCDVVCSIDPTCCSVEWDADCVTLAQNNCIVGGPAPVVRINEIRISEPSTNANEYFELKANPGTSLNGVAYVVIGDAEGAFSGVVESITYLDGNSVLGDGHFLVAEDNDTLGAPADLIAFLNFENDDNVTHMLLFNFTGALGDDLDGNNDGVLDVTPWTSIIDSIGLLHTPLPPANTGEEWVYSATQLGPIDGFVPAHAYRCEPTGTWKAGRFDWDANNDLVPDAADTPGVVNLGCAAASCGSPFAGDCFSANGTPGCEVESCCNDVCAIDPFCCEVSWDDACATQAAITCADPCGGPFAENCYQANSGGEGGCDNPVCCNIVCAMDPTCCSGEWDSVCVDLANSNCVFRGKAPNVILNEVRIDQTGTDNDEYVEIKGAPGTSLNGVHVIVVGDGAALSGSGVVEGWVDLTGSTIPADGHFVVVESTFTLGAADLILPPSNSGNAYGLNFENSDNVTFVLAFNYKGSIDTDLDINDDGFFDPPFSWSSIIDTVALVENLDMPPTGTEWWYGSTTVGPDIEFVPGHAYRCETDGTWTIGAFDTASVDAADTPGALNEACEGGSDCIGDIVNSGTILPPPDGVVDGADLAYLIGAWGANPGSPADFVTSATLLPPPDGIVDGADLAVLIGAWGPCPN